MACLLGFIDLRELLVYYLNQCARGEFNGFEDQATSVYTLDEMLDDFLADYTQRGMRDSLYAPEAGLRDAKWWLGFAQARIKQITAWSRLFALVAMALLVVASLATRLLLRGSQHASALLRRVTSRRRGRCELRLISAMISLLHQEPGLYDHLVPRIKLKLEGDLANVS